MYTLVTLDIAISINVSDLASHMPSYRYRGPFVMPHNNEKIDSEWIMNDNDGYKKIIGFDKPTSSNAFTEIVSDYSPTELACKLSQIPKTIVDPIIEALRNTKLAISPLDSWEMESCIFQSNEIERKASQRCFISI